MRRITQGPIKAAAIRFEGSVYWVKAPGRHNHVINKILKETGAVRVGGEEQGFITQDNVFVNRTEAAQLAVESGQIDELNWPPYLYSEDVW